MGISLSVPVKRESVGQDEHQGEEQTDRRSVKQVWNKNLRNIYCIRRLQLTNLQARGKKSDGWTDKKTSWQIAKEKNTDNQTVRQMDRGGDTTKIRPTRPKVAQIPNFV